MKNGLIKKIFCLFFTFVLVVTLVSCSNADKPDDTVRVGDEISVIYPQNGAVVSLLSEEITKWLENSDVKELVSLYDHTEKCEPVPVQFKWSGENAENVRLLLADNAELSGAVEFEGENSVEVEDLLPGKTYYYRFDYTFNGKKSQSEVFSFETSDQPRTLYIDGVSNVRDLGGVKTTDGKHVKFNVLFRGADLENITEKGKDKAVNTLKIKTELDLRGNEKDGKSPFGDGVQYLFCEMPYYENAVSADNSAEIVKALKVFADPDNYPVYFHCSLGRDRTGTLAYFLYAIAEVEDEDRIYEDYLLSYFSDLGGHEDDSDPEMYLSHLYSVRSAVSGTRTKQMNPEKTKKILMSFGLTEEEITAIRNNIVE